MTPEERAEKIGLTIRRGHPPCDVCGECEYMIAAEIRAAIEEAVEERGRLFQRNVDKFPEELKQVYADAIEDAASCLEPLYIMKGSENDGMVFIPHAQKAIRALEGKK